ncbi:MAG: cell envelope integrity EipB family protein [Zavarzinia sp.]|nr:cell envelope integrity EipB family protein [Zavarzinia sp.]
MLRRAIALTTILVVLFFIGRWAFVGGEEGASAGQAASEPQIATLSEPQATSGSDAAVSATASNVTDTAAIAPAVPATFDAEMGRLAGHRAIYDLKLAASNNGSGIAAAEGRMVIEFSDTCDGYALNQRLQMRLSDGEGAATATDFRVANWEATDGRRFRFATRHIVNGEEDQNFEGSAELKADGSGIVDYVKPEAKEETLPPGTIFPTMHTVQLIEAARAHKPLLTRTMFDGTNEDLGSNVVGVIGRVGDVAPPGLKGKGLDLLKGLPSWPVRLAFFGTGNNEELPEYEVGFRLYANGISGDIVLDYGDFSIDAVLSDIEALPRPAC